VTHPTISAKTLSELIAYVKSNPGKLSYASFSPGTPSHFLGVQMNDRFGLDMAHVPYRGSGPQTNDLIAGHALIGFGQLGSVKSHIASGKLNAIAITSPQRSRFLTDVPTFAELGYPEFTTTVWFGLFLRAGTPAPIIKAYTDAAIAAHKDPEVKSKLEATGFDVIAEMGPQVAESIRQQTERWRKLIEGTGFQISD
jgi:tripartite-type tricarboxylate transporter receptor subunit TctC